MKKNLINITLFAKQRLEKIAHKNNTNYILFSVQGGGCNGFKYNLEPSNSQPKKIDEIVITKKNEIIKV